MIKKFKEKTGVIYNPYIGFTSFNHFRDEALYSDYITGRNNVAGNEMENYECYPVPDGVEENGRAQGYYPDTTVAYIRILWKEFEPKQGEYNYAFIQDILDKAKAKGQTVMFRLMPHSSCARDDVPDWLKEIMDCPERPAGVSTEASPTDPRYLKLFGNAVEKLGLRFDKDETLDCVDVAIGGAWGEGAQDFPIEDLEALMDIYIRVFPNTKLIGQFVNAHLIEYIHSKRKIGWRADGTGSPKHMNQIFPSHFPLLPKDIWKTAPVSFESYWWISEWVRQGWDIDAIIARTLEWHISSFNTKSFPIPYELQEKVDKWIERMGYRFVIREVEYPENVQAGKTAKIRLKIENKGVAPIYNKLPLKMRFKGKKTQEYTTSVDVTRWLPDIKEEEVILNVASDTPKGEYRLEIAIGGGDKPFVNFANELQTEGEWHSLSTIKID